MPVTRTPKARSSASIKETWTADTEKELRDLFKEVEYCYPTMGYGTSLNFVKFNEDTKLWEGEFYRYTCCD